MSGSTYFIIVGLVFLLIIALLFFRFTRGSNRKKLLRGNDGLEPGEKMSSWPHKFPELSEATIDRTTKKPFRIPPNVSMSNEGREASYGTDTEYASEEPLPKSVLRKLFMFLRRKKTLNLPEAPSVLDSLDKMLANSMEYDDVCLGLSSPSAVTPGQNFVIRFSAYLEKQEQQVHSLLQQLAPADRHILNVDSFQWKRDTEITVRVYSEFLLVPHEAQKFIWHGRLKILNFDVQVADHATIGKYVDVKVDVMIAGIVIGRLRLSLKIDTETSDDTASVKSKPYQSAFASYARQDTDLVKHRLSEIERNGVKIFWDRFSLHTGKRWQPQLDAAIKDNEIFLLFWSANAKASQWVEWEWRAALKYKGVDGIEPHPLQDPETAPPPDELRELHFDDKYLYFLKNKPTSGD